MSSKEKQQKRVDKIKSKGQPKKWPTISESLDEIEREMQPITDLVHEYMKGGHTRDELFAYLKSVDPASLATDKLRWYLAEYIDVLPVLWELHDQDVARNQLQSSISPGVGGE